ncbi:MAG: hypothetical protein RM049_26215 [Nostoc sp. DedQUE04]|uniref:hypothetical protein n=1 Tax=Nostoc sp. DedQUE04 TaxID=3075390 RepID=UPI002AD38E3C|nr:hypothetical protein [Nostoc sp. DedQUE04]MDZ8138758.1 hypothetical protein [Nostoc sp. DedQUE04]
MGHEGDEGAGEAGEEELLIIDQCPMPNAQCPMPNAQCPMPKIHISFRMMIERVQKPDRFSYQRVKTGEDESPGYWW